MDDDPDDPAVGDAMAAAARVRSLAAGAEHPLSPWRSHRLTVVERLESADGRLIVVRRVEPGRYARSFLEVCEHGSTDNAVLEIYHRGDFVGDAGWLPERAATTTAHHLIDRYDLGDAGAVTDFVLASVTARAVQPRLRPTKLFRADRSTRVAVARDVGSWGVLVIPAIVGLLAWNLLIASAPLYSDQPTSETGSYVYLGLLTGVAAAGGFVLPRHGPYVGIALVLPGLLLAPWTAPRGDNDGLWILIFPMLGVFAFFAAGVALATGMLRTALRQSQARSA